MAGSATVTIGGQRLPGLPFFCAPAAKPEFSEKPARFTSGWADELSIASLESPGT
jgi:hypothetical protein